MAVTGFWPVFKNLKATLDYADNPDKTTALEYLDEDLYAALGGVGAQPPKSQPTSAVIGTFVAHKVPACYIVRRTPQGIKKSG